ncbi:MAG: hypothetical protein AB7P76_08770 [Candidatus Melainabacteria bacterium]
MLTFFFVILLTLEVTVVNLIAQRSLGEGAILSTQNISARYAQSAAFNRLEQALNQYLMNNGTTGIETAFAKGGAQEIDETLDVTNPETGSTETGTVNIQAWLAQRRGIWYKIGVRARVADIDLVAFRWFKLNPCSNTSSGQAGVLTTILTGGKKPGYQATAADSTGRVFFAENTGTGNNVYTWKESTGLSTVAANLQYPARDGMVVGADNRLYFGEGSNTGVIRTWLNGVLSTISPSLINPGVAGAIKVSSTGRLFFGQENTSGRMFTWQSGVLSTISPIAFNNTGQQSIRIAGNGRLYFGNGAGCCAGNFFTWMSGVLSTILPSAVGCPGGNGALAVDANNRVYFSDSCTSTNARIWTWEVGTGLSTISTAAKYPGHGNALVADNNNRVFIGEDSTAGRLYTYTTTTGLSTLVSGFDYIGVGGGNEDARSIGVDGNNRVFFGGYNINRLWTWRIDTGLSTLVSGINSMGYESIIHDESNRTFFMGSYNGNFVYTWDASTGLSTIGSGMNDPGYNKSVAAKNGRLIFGSWYEMRTWKAGDGLSTLVNTQDDTGKYSTVVANDGTFYFGQMQDPGNFWAWKPGSPLSSCQARNY